MFPLSVTGHFVLTKTPEVTEITLVHFHSYVRRIRMELSPVTDHVVPPGEALVTKVTCEPDAKVNMLFVLLHFVFSAECLVTEAALEWPVL